MRGEGEGMTYEYGIGGGDLGEAGRFYELPSKIRGGLCMANAEHTILMPTMRFGP